MELLNQIGTLLAEAGAAEQAAQAEATAEYRSLLARADAPKKGDAARLTALLGTLKLTLADAQADAAALAEGRRLKALADAHTDAGFSARSNAAGAALAAHRTAAAKRLLDDEEKTAALIASVSTLSHERDTWRKHCREFDALRAANPRIPI
jgi:hypothetical protein